MTNSHFTQSKKVWSARKHAILTAYLRPFCTALSKKASKIWYVDGYAGAGSYLDEKDANKIEPGSPVLAAQLTQDLPYPISCINVEEDRQNYDSLVDATSSFDHVTNILGDFTSVIDTILQTVHNYPTFFFLDSFGTIELPMQGLIEKIVRRSKPTDILLRYATGAVQRLAGSYDKDPQRGSKNALHLDRWFNGSDWRSIVDNLPAGTDRDQALLSYYIDQIKATSPSHRRLNHVYSYPIRDEKGIIKYHLIFATGDKLGAKIMSDTLYKAEQNFNTEYQEYLRNQNETPGQLSMLDPYESPKQSPQVLQKQICQAILKVGKQQTTWEFDDLRCELLFNQGWFAQLTDKDFRAACKELHEQNKIQRISTNNAWSRETRFYIIPD